MAVIRGPSVRLWFENCAENRKRCCTTERGCTWGGARGGEGGLASLAYYGPRYYRGTHGISSAQVKWLKNFRLGYIDDSRERERERERRKIRTEKLDTPRDISRAECDNLCFTFNKTKRGRRRAIEPLTAGLFSIGFIIQALRYARNSSGICVPKDLTL